MILRTSAIKTIRKDRECRKRLIAYFNITSTTLYRWLSANSNDGELTRVSALNIIHDTTGLAQYEILREQKEKVS